MNAHPKQPYTWQDVQYGVVVIGFTARDEEHDPDATHAADVAEFKQRLTSLAASTAKVLAVIGFANYCMTDWDNGRTVIGAVLVAAKRLKTNGGDLLVCNHPVQFNPDLQNMFHFDGAIGICRTRREAIEAARSRVREGGA